MKEENIKQQHSEKTSEKNSVISWIKEHKSQLLLAGISVTTVILTVMGIKNRETLTDLWKSLKKQIEKGALYSSKWFERASLEELEKARKIVQKDFNNPKLDLDYRIECWNLLNRFDNAIGKIKWNGKEYGCPVHSSNGWHLPSDD
mgnify:FL=1